MKRRNLILISAAALAVAGVAGAKTGFIPENWIPWSSAGAEAPAAPTQVERAVPVDVATAVKKKVPVRIDLLGTVTPIASVAVKTRVDATTIESVQFQDGAEVKKGDVLFKLDTRSLEAQLHQAEGNLQKDQAQLEGAMRDVKRYTELVGKGATPVTNLEQAQTQEGIFHGA